MTKRKICVLTGTRAEFGLLRPVMDSVLNHDKLELAILVTGMHLSPEFGHTVDEIQELGYEVAARVEMNPESDTGSAMAKAVGRGIEGITDSLAAIQPDVLVVLGDRIEVLSGVIAAAYLNVAIAHIHGGDVSKAGLDESVRHAVTKMAHIHFPATKKSAERILKMGEVASNVHIAGAPCLDTILNVQLKSSREIAKQLNFSLDAPLLIVVQHSVSTEPDKAESQIVETLAAIKQFKHQTVLIYPNSDAGGRVIIEHIERFKNNSFVRCFKNLSHVDYLSLLKAADVLIGNSSSGIIESSSFGLPVVNIGIRQEGRERAGNVLDVSHDRHQIAFAIDKCLSSEFKAVCAGCINPYGQGSAGTHIANVLANVSLDESLVQKMIAY